MARQENRLTVELYRYIDQPIYISRYQGQAEISYWLSTIDKISAYHKYLELFIFESKHVRSWLLIAKLLYFWFVFLLNNTGVWLVLAKVFLWKGINEAFSAKSIGKIVTKSCSYPVNISVIDINISLKKFQNIDICLKKLYRSRSSYQLWCICPSGAISIYQYHQTTVWQMKHAKKIITGMFFVQRNQIIKASYQCSHSLLQLTISFKIFLNSKKVVIVSCLNSFCCFLFLNYSKKVRLLYITHLMLKAFSKFLGTSNIKSNIILTAIRWSI